MSAAAPRPRERGRCKVTIRSRIALRSPPHPDPPWNPRQPEIGPKHERTSTNLRRLLAVTISMPLFLGLAGTLLFAQLFDSSCGPALPLPPADVSLRTASHRPYRQDTWRSPVSPAAQPRAGPASPPQPAPPRASAALLTTQDRTRLSFTSDPPAFGRPSSSPARCGCPSGSERTRRHTCPPSG